MPRVIALLTTISLPLALFVGCDGTAAPPRPTAVRPAAPPSPPTTHRSAPPPTWKRVDLGATPAGPRAIRAAGPETSAPPRRPTDAPPKAPAPVAPKTEVTTVRMTMTTALSNTHVLMPGTGVVDLAVDLVAGKALAGKRLPVNLAIVIDRSGSMRGQKIERTRAAARHVLGLLQDGDTVAIVSYSDDVRVDFPASTLDEESRKRALSAIRRVRASGSTNLSGGLIRGQGEVERNLRTGQVNRVILMSDGLANRGITDTKALSQHVQRASQRGITVTTLGVGADYNEDLMTAVADHGGGEYYFVEKASAIAAVFAQELQKMFATVAQSTRVELRLDDGVDLVQVFGYAFSQSGDTLSIPLAEVYAGQRRSILVRVRVPVVREGRHPVGALKLAYTDVQDNEKAVEAALELGVQVTRDKALVEKNRNKTIEERSEEIEVATSMEKAANLLKAGRGDDAKAVLARQAASTRRRARAMGGSARMAGEAAKLDRLQKAFEPSADRPAGAVVKDVKAASRKMMR